MAAWNNIDDGLIALFRNQLGEESAYQTLQVVTIKSIIMRAWSDFDKWIFPAIAIVGRLAGRNQTEHGTLGSRAMGKTYTYTLFGLVEGDAETAARDAKELDKRMEQALLVRSLEIAGEHFRISTPGASVLTAGKRASSVHPDWWYVATAMSATIQTHT